MSPRYTLEAALVARRARTDKETERLAAEKDRVRVALEEVERQRAGLADFDAARRRAEAEERARLEEGQGRALDLAFAAATRRAQDLARERLCAELAAAEANLERARGAEAQAAKALSTAFAEQRAVERHREAWDRARLVAAEHALDEQAQETWNPARFESFKR